MTRAVALLSGGLDSTLAILTVLKQDIEITALRFLTPFDSHSFHSTPYSEYLLSTAELFGFEIKTSRLDDKFIDIVRNPIHGYGKNMNPCIDCRILMLKEAKVFMETIGASFIITGEVLGQRPMSQRRDTFYLIDREAGVSDLAVRPLSAKLLKITYPEAEGIIRREMLYDLSGRSRKQQIALAKKFGLTDYPAPAGGCLLTEPIFARRLRDLLKHIPFPHIRDIDLLKIGRHFRFSPSCKIIVGRDKVENEKILSLSLNGDYLLKAEGFGSPVTLLSGENTDEAIPIAASLCARYSDAKDLPDVEISVSKGDDSFKIKVQPIKNELLEKYRVKA